MWYALKHGLRERISFKNVPKISHPTSEVGDGGWTPFGGMTRYSSREAVKPQVLPRATNCFSKVSSNGNSWGKLRVIAR
jgi:hypothetical protein